MPQLRPRGTASSAELLKDMLKGCCTDGDNKGAAPQEYEAQNNVFANLMVISTSLAIGLVLGFSVVSFVESVASRCSCCPRRPCRRYLRCHLQTRHRHR